MNSAPDETQFPSLFAHRLRTEWGVGVLSGEKDGKRRYLFENGDERALASGFYDLMRRVESPTPEQQLTYARLQGVLAARVSNDGSGKGAAWTLSGQLARFRMVYSDGLSDQTWTSEVRGAGGKRGLGQRQAILQKAQTVLSRAAIDAAIEAGRHVEVWDALVSVLTSTDLVPAAQLKRAPAAGEPQRNVAVRVRELLHGEGNYDQRFDRWVTALTLGMGEAPRWELATAPSGVFHPREHLCVEGTAFRKQLKACGGRAAPGLQPTSSGYASFLSVARLLANQLASHGEVPRDLLDVRDFVVVSLKPVPKAAGATAKSSKKASREVAGLDDSPQSLDD
jgi:hypothetical protein